MRGKLISAVFALVLLGSLLAGCGNSTAGNDYRDYTAGTRSALEYNGVRDATGMEGQNRLAPVYPNGANDGYVEGYQYGDNTLDNNTLTREFGDAGERAKIGMEDTARDIKNGVNNAGRDVKNTLEDATR